MPDLSDYKARLGTPVEFIGRLRAALAMHGVSQARLAHAAGVCPTQISRWFSGRVRPGLETMIRLDRALEEILRGA